jgi:hypothetical protein
MGNASTRDDAKMNVNQRPPVSQELDDGPKLTDQVLSLDGAIWQLQEGTIRRNGPASQEEVVVVRNGLPGNFDVLVVSSFYSSCQ